MDYSVATRVRINEFSRISWVFNHSYSKACILGTARRNAIERNGRPLIRVRFGRTSRVISRGRGHGSTRASAHRNWNELRLADRFLRIASDNERDARDRGSGYRCTPASRAEPSERPRLHSSVSRGSLRSGAIRPVQPPITSLIKCLTNSALCGLI